MDFILRVWRKDDLESLVRYANNFNIAKNLTDRYPYPYTPEDGVQFIGAVAALEPPQVFAIEINGEAAGSIGLHPQNDIYSRNAELGYWLAEPFWGQGIVTRAVKEMVEYGFNTWEIDRIFARPFHTNLASQRVLMKAGFIKEAEFSKSLFKNGEYYDELVFAVRRR